MQTFDPNMALISISTQGTCHLLPYKTLSMTSNVVIFGTLIVECFDFFFHVIFVTMIHFLLEVIFVVRL